MLSVKIEWQGLERFRSFRRCRCISIANLGTFALPGTQPPMPIV